METRTTEELLQRAIDQITCAARSGVNDEAQVAEAVAAKVKSQGLDYTVRWIENDLFTSFVAHLWASVDLVASNTDGDYVRALRDVVKEQERQLLGNRIIERSTSGLSNAVTHMKAHAAAKFVENGRGWLDLIDEYEAKIA